jgi:hypothetical protein
VVLPEDTGDTKPGSPWRGGLVIAGLVVSLAALFAIGLLTRPVVLSADSTLPHIPASTTTGLDRPFDPDNFTVDQIATGVPLEWSRVAVIAEMRPHSLVTHEGRVYVFTTNEDWEGLSVWRLSDGHVWEALGFHLEDEVYLRQVAASPQGLLVANSGSEARIWSSEDGETWEAVPLPVTLKPDSLFDPIAYGATSDDLMVGFTTSYNYPGDRLGERVAAHLGTDPNRLNWGWTPTGDGLIVIIEGPLGLGRMEVPSAELGLTAEDVSQIVEQRPDNQAFQFWVRSAGTWRETSTDDMGSIETVYSLGDEFLVVTNTDSGQLLMRSDDGVNWERMEPGRPYAGVTTGGGRAAIYSNSPRLVLSDDGMDWVETDLIEHFPGTIAWETGPVSIGSEAMAAMVATWPATTAPPPSPDPVNIEVGRFTLFLNPEQGVLSLSNAEGRWSWPIYTGENDEEEGVAVDFSNETVTFSDPETGDHLLDLTFDELREAENRWYTQQSPLPPTPQQALAYSKDGVQWVVQDMAGVLGGGKEVTHLAVTDTTLVAAVIDSQTWRYGLAGDVEIWVGTPG